MRSLPIKNKTTIISTLLISFMVFGLSCSKEQAQTALDKNPINDDVSKELTVQNSADKKLKLKSQASSLVYLDAISLQTKLQQGELSAAQVTEEFLARIQAYDVDGPAINSIIEINPDASEIAKKLDMTFSNTGPVGLLHGIPVLLKANIDTKDRMVSSAGSLALANHFANEDAPLVKSLRDAGAVILGKTNLSEWANFRSSNSSSGWSSLGGLTKNPYVLDRNPCGSSSGSAVAVSAHFAPLAVGTETDGSVVCPSSVNGVVGIKPTLGRISAKGIIPISATQDTAGPMATTVAGAELLYQVLHGLEFEPPLDEVKLKGLRVGVWRNYFGAQDNPEVNKVFTQAIQSFQSAGSDIVDDILLEGTGPANTAEYEVLLFEFKDGLNKYFDQAGLGFNLENLIEFNNDNADVVMPYFAQEILLAAQEKGDLQSPEYKQALQDSHIAMQEILKTVFAENKLDVLIAPTNQPAWKTTLGDGDLFKLSSSGPAAISGYPNVSVPMGNVNGLPIGLSLIGLENDDEKLIAIAKQFETLAQARILPTFISSLE